MDIIDQIAEAAIQEAMARGEFDNLPGAGQPLVLDDDALVPPELRAAYRLLKNAGFLPPELQLRKEIAAAEQLLMAVEDAAEQARARARLDLLRLRLEQNGRGRVDLRLEEGYYHKLLERMER